MEISTATVVRRFLQSAIQSKVIHFFEPFLKKQDDFIREWITDEAETIRSRALKLYPTPTSSKYGFGDSFQKRVQWDAWIEKYGMDKLREIIRKYKGYQPELTDQEAADIFDRLEVIKGPSFFSIRHKDPKRDQIPPEVGAAVAAFGWDGVHDNAVFQRSVNKEVRFAIEANRIKITAAIDKYLGKLPITTVEEITLRRGRQGIEGAFQITLDDGTVGTMVTNSIGAGGWNIQRFHLRYLIKVSPELKERVIRKVLA